MPTRCLVPEGTLCPFMKSRPVPLPLIGIPTSFTMLALLQGRKSSCWKDPFSSPHHTQQVVKEDQMTMNRYQGPWGTRFAGPQLASAGLWYTVGTRAGGVAGVGLELPEPLPRPWKTTPTTDFWPRNWMMMCHPLHRHARHGHCPYSGVWPWWLWENTRAQGHHFLCQHYGCSTSVPPMSLWWPPHRCPDSPPVPLFPVE